jgi:proteasome lid subunit RPN8/RPN11
MRLPWRPAERVTISRSLWKSLLTGLAQRGNGQRESGAFLLSSDRRRVHEIVFFDDLDPDCLVGSIELAGHAFSTLWDHCRATQQRVLADVHTHPGPSVAFSELDRANPMVARAGHVAIVIPDYAQSALTRRQIGVHRYDGEDGWTSFFADAAQRRVRLVNR